MFTLDQTTGSITNAIRHLMNDPCPGKVEVAIHSNESRSAMWLLVRWGRFNFITLPAPIPVPNTENLTGDHFKWFECRDGEETIYSGKKWLCAVTIPVEPDRNLVRDAVTVAIGKLREKVRANEDLIYKQMQKAAG